MLYIHHKSSKYPCFNIWGFFVANLRPGSNRNSGVDPIRTGFFFVLTQNCPILKEKLVICWFRNDLVTYNHLLRCMRPMTEDTLSGDEWGCSSNINQIAVKPESNLNTRWKISIVVKKDVLHIWIVMISGYLKTMHITNLTNYLISN